ncbi:MAG: VWA domain-containing protein [Alphaproteobacteria bacterium]|nr:VWA domain-containing protein [Alphaproteobacteria bacterium]
MSFLWPSLLWLLLLVPALVGVYVWLLRRRKQGVVRFANMGLLKQAMGPSGWRRHLPPALLLAAMTLLLLAVARPSAMVSLPSHRATVMMAMDVSGSMRAADIKPSRIEASQKAAKEYIKEQPKDVVIGMVAFAGVAFLIQTPTTDRQALDSAIDHFELQRGTAVGNGILVSLQSLFPQENFPISSFNNGGYGGGGGMGGYGGGGGGYGGFSRFGRTNSGSCGRVDENSGSNFGRPLGQAGGAPPKKHVPVEPGSYKNGVIILMTDGQTNSGCDPIEAARLASEYGVRVFTIGFGTTRGNDVSFGGFAMRAQLDEESLKKIADMTKGKYFKASSSEDLKAVYDLLTKQLVVEVKEMEISSFFAAAAALVMMVAAGLSVAWFGRIF